MTPYPHYARRGLTLIEVMVLIAVVAVLVAVFVPTIGNSINNHGNAANQNNASQIAKTYIAYANAGNNVRSITTPAMNPGSNRNTGTASNIEDVAFILAKFTQLNDASLWFNRRDENLSGKTIPRLVIVGDLSKATECSADFIQCWPKAWTFVTGISPSAPATSTPLLWTYGLQHDGTWSKDSPWHGTGGHIAYLDGHVEWADKLSTTPDGIGFTIYATRPGAGGMTADYSQAINASAVVVNAMGR